MLDQIPRSESLHDTMLRSSVYWDTVITPALREGRSLLIVGHENNLRSLVMRLEGIAPEDIINLNIPRAVPLAYRLDEETLQPLNRLDGQLDEATGMLRGEWIGGDKAVAEILKRDHKQVYDTTITQNLEIGDKRDSFNQWMNFLIGEASPEAKAEGLPTRDGSLHGSTPASGNIQRDRFHGTQMIEGQPGVSREMPHISNNDNEKSTAAAA